MTDDEVWEKGLVQAFQDARAKIAEQAAKIERLREALRLADAHLAAQGYEETGEVRRMIAWLAPAKEGE